MKKKGIVKRILSAMLSCVLMVSSLPAGQIFSYADTTSSSTAENVKKVQEKAKAFKSANSMDSTNTGNFTWDSANGTKRWTYYNGMMMDSYAMLSNALNNEDYLKYVENFYDNLCLNEDGSIKDFDSSTLGSISAGLGLFDLPEKYVTLTSEANVVDATIVGADGGDRVANVSGNKITFNAPQNATGGNGLEVKNPFTDMDITDGAAISFWYTPVSDVSGVTDWEGFSFDKFVSLISIKNENGLIKFDMGGTRQGGGYNYLASYSFKEGKKYFITLTMNNGGLQYYVNGADIGYIYKEDKNEQSTIKGNYSAIKSILENNDTNIYIGGSINNYQYAHAVPEGTIVEDVKFYNGYYGDAEVAKLYAQQKNIANKQTAVIQNDNSVANIDGNKITFNDNSVNSEVGVSVKNPFTDMDLSEGVSISFWYTSAEGFDENDNSAHQKSLFTALSSDTEKILKFDTNGTRQYNDRSSNRAKAWNYWTVESPLVINKRYFVTCVVASDGLYYYVNGVNIEPKYTSDNDKGYVCSSNITMSTICEFLKSSDTSIYIGGAKFNGMYYAHAVPYGTVVEDVTFHEGALDASEAIQLYAQQLETEEKFNDSNKVYIVSDSIAAGTIDDENNVTSIGWGNVIDNTCFNDSKLFVNKAKAGDSTKSYKTGQLYDAVFGNADEVADDTDTVLNEGALSKGDYVIISLGHNDWKYEGAKDDNGNWTWTQNSSKYSSIDDYKNNLKKYYIQPALKVGATPILMTPVARSYYAVNTDTTDTSQLTKTDYEGSTAFLEGTDSLPVEAGQEHLEYGAAMRELVSEYAKEGIVIRVIDAQKFTYDTYSGMNFDQATQYHATAAWEANDPYNTSWNNKDGIDNTHYNQKGAEWISGFITGSLSNYNLEINEYAKDSVASETTISKYQTAIQSIYSHLSNTSEFTTLSDKAGNYVVKDNTNLTLKDIYLAQRFLMECANAINNDKLTLTDSEGNEVNATTLYEQIFTSLKWASENLVSSDTSNQQKAWFGVALVDAISLFPEGAQKSALTVYLKKLVDGMLKSQSDGMWDNDFITTSMMSYVLLKAYKEGATISSAYAKAGVEAFNAAVEKGLDKVETTKEENYAVGFAELMMASVYVKDVEAKIDDIAAETNTTEDTTSWNGLTSSQDYKYKIVNSMISGHKDGYLIRCGGSQINKSGYIISFDKDNTKTNKVDTIITEKIDDNYYRICKNNNGKSSLTSSHLWQAEENGDSIIIKSKNNGYCYLGCTDGTLSITTKENACKWTFTTATDTNQTKVATVVADKTFYLGLNSDNEWCLSETETSVTIWERSSFYNSSLALAGTLSYVINQDSFTNEEIIKAVKSNAVILKKTDSVIDEEISLSADNIKLTWDKDLKTGVPGTYIAKVNYEDNELTLGTISVEVKGEDIHIYYDSDCSVPVEETTIKEEYTGAENTYQLYLFDGFKNSLPANTVYKWSTSNPAVAKVNGSGKVTFVGSGDVRISVEVISNQTLSTESVKTAYVDFILTKSSKVKTDTSDTNYFPTSGQPGNVSISKNAYTSDTNYYTTGVAKLKLDVTGIPATNPVDVILVMDVSRSMVGLGKYWGTNSKNEGAAIQDSSDTGIINYDKLNYLRDSATDFIEQLLGANSQNRVALVQFSDDAVDKDNNYYEINSRVISNYAGVEMKDKLISLINNGVDTTSTYVNSDYNEEKVSSDEIKTMPNENIESTKYLNGAGDGYIPYGTTEDNKVYGDYSAQAESMIGKGLTLSNRGGTNYGLAFKMVEKVIEADTLSNEGREQIVLFMTDGGPSCINIGEDSIFASGYTTDSKAETQELNLNETRTTYYKVGEKKPVAELKKPENWSKFALNRNFVAKSRIEAKGYEIISLAYDLTNDNAGYFGNFVDDNNVEISADDAKVQVLKNIATNGDSGYYEANEKNLTQVYREINNKILYTATNTVISDTIGENFELRYWPYNNSEGNKVNSKIEVIQTKKYDSKIHNFTADLLKSEFYFFNNFPANGAVQKRDTNKTPSNSIIVNYNNKELIKAVKLQATNSITFTPDYDGKLTLVFGNRGDIESNNKAVTINDKDYFYQAEGDHFIVTCDVYANSKVTIKKTSGEDVKEPYLYYIDYTANPDALVSVVETVEFTKDSSTNGVTAKSNLKNEILATITNDNKESYKINAEYFDYDALTKKFTYKVGELTPDTTFTIQYDAYLKGSIKADEKIMGYENDNNRFKPENNVLYDTNESAYVTYDNVNGDACCQVYEKPKLPWNSGKITYKFYLAKKTQSGEIVPIDNNAKIINGGVEDYVIIDSISDVVNLNEIGNSTNPNKTSFIDAKEESEVVKNGLDNRTYSYIITDTAGNPIGTYTIYNDGYKYVEKIEPNDGKDLGVFMTGVDGTGSDTTVYFPLTLVNIATNVSDAVVLDYGLNVDIDLLANDNVGSVLSNISLVSIRPLSATTGKLPAQSADMDSQFIDQNRSSLNMNLEFVDDKTYDVSGNDKWRINKDIIARKPQSGYEVKNQALVINGSKTANSMDGVYLVDTNILSNVTEQNYTFSTWIKPSSSGTILYSVGNDRTLNIKLNSDMKLEVELTAASYDYDNRKESGTRHFIITANAVVDKDKWTFVTVTYDNADGLFKIYYNGQQQTTSYSAYLDANNTQTEIAYNTAIPSPFNSYNQKFYLGACPSDVSLINATVDGVKLYSAALSGEELLSIYNGTNNNYAENATSYGDNGNEFELNGKFYQTGGNTYAVAEDTYGKSVIETKDYSLAERKNVHVTYSLNKTLDGADDFMYALRYDYKDDSESNYVYGTLKVLPANSVYYEDNFVGITYTPKKDSESTGIGKIVSEGTSISDVQDFQLADMQDAGVVYGFDNHYKNNTTYSNGTVTEMGSMAIAKFTFKGTGFDIFSRTNKNTGEVAVVVKPVDKDGNADATRKTQIIIRNLYFDDGDLYQIPVISLSDLDYGYWEVQIQGRYPLDKETGKYDKNNNLIFYLDGIRVYNPLGTSAGDENAELRETYYAEGENNAEFKEIRNIMLDANKIQLVTFDKNSNIISTSDAYTTTEWLPISEEDKTEHDNPNSGTYYKAEQSAKGWDDYLNRGPNNELYLSPGQAITFQVKSTDATERTLQVAAKTPNLDSAEMTINVGDINASSKEINTKAEQYYKITTDKLESNTQIVIANTGTGTSADGFISLTDLKINGYEIVDVFTTVNVSNVPKDYELVEGTRVYSITKDDVTEYRIYGTYVDGLGKENTGWFICDIDGVLQGYEMARDSEEATNAATAQAMANVASLNNVLKLFETELVIPESEATVGGYTLSLDGDIGVNYYLSLSDEIMNDPDAYVQFTFEDGTSEFVPVSEGIEKTVDGKTYYMFSCDVAAKEINDEVKAQVVNGDGISSKTYSYSVKKYAEQILANEASYSKELVELVKAMLNYGSYAQQLFAYKTADLANNGLDISMDAVSIGEEFEYELTGEVDGIDYYGASLVLKSETSIRYYFKLTGDKDISNYTFVSNGEVLDAVEANGIYYVTIADIAAKDLGDMYSIEVYDNVDDNKAMSVKFGAMTYAQQVLASDEQSEELKNVVCALYLYWKAAEAYFTLTN